MSSIKQNEQEEQSQDSSIGGAFQQMGASTHNKHMREDIAAIDQKMAEAACDQPHMPAASSKRTGAELEQCVTTCQKVTGGDASACFKDCAQ